MRGSRVIFNHHFRDLRRHNRRFRIRAGKPYDGID
jgi:hypothetical protein